MADEDNSPISSSDAKRLFADWKAAPAIILAVSGGPDSVAMMWLAARWRRALKTGPPLVAVTLDPSFAAKAARATGATHVLTAHTRDDQAETLLMRMSRGSGIAGLAGIARQSARDGVVLVRPLLHIPKARLVATLKQAKITFADDPTNRDAGFTRPRFRAIMPVLAAEGCDARN